MHINEGYSSEIISISPHGTNSTMFTTCCEVAICNDQLRCPHCSRNVIGHDAETDHARGRIRWRNATRGWRI